MEEAKPPNPAGRQLRWWWLASWLPQYLMQDQRRIRAQGRLLALSVLVGIVAGLAAILFFLATRVVEHYALDVVAGYQPSVRPAGEVEISWLPAVTRPFRPWLLLVIPTIGGLLSGAIVFTFAPEAEGHGTDSVIEAYHQHQGRIRPRVPLVKIVASALTIGTGGSGGREGPIAQIGAGFGSLLATLLRLTTTERRILLAAGMGAGIAAIFRAPLAGALFAAEVLYSSPEFEPEVIMPAAISSVVSYCTFGLYAGWEPLFKTPDLVFSNPLELIPYTLLALFVVVLAAIYTHSFYGLVHVFHRLPMPRQLRPAVGAFLAAAIGLGLYYAFGRQHQMLAVLSFGYGAIQEALSDSTKISAWVLLAIALGKILTTGLTIGSGGSGGVFGPAMVIGGCGGGALGIVLHQLWPTLVPHPASFAIIGMAGFFAAAAKTPISTLVIVSEMTGGYHLLLPSLWVCVLAFVLSDEKSIYSAQVVSRNQSPAHRGAFARQLLQNVKVSGFLTPGQPVPSLALNDPLATVLDRLESSGFLVLPVVDGEQRLLGIVNLDEVYLATQIHPAPPIVAEDLMRHEVQPLTPSDTVDRALELFVENDLMVLPVVSDLEQRKLVGLVRRLDIARSYLHHVHGPKSGDRPA
ncbi:MAG: chloride channel protein [Planctomycetia bacterium]|nr:chloride channel protein [Planctomycetia bacterium]